MFCKKCGGEIPENVRFCPKCGAAAGQPPARGSRPSLPSGQGVRLPVSFPRVWMAGAAAAVLLLAVVIGVCLGKGSGASGEGVSASGEAESRAEGGHAGEETEASKDQEHDIDSLNVSSAVTLEGEYANLRSVTMSPGEDGAVSAITYLEGASFPVLESLECGAVLKATGAGGRECFDWKDFPQLKNVTMKLVNRYIDEDIMMTYQVFQEMYDAGQLQSFQVENSHTIEDLYGTWTGEGQLLSLSFEKDGMLQIADASNLVGVDVLAYREIDDDTLGLSAKDAGLWGMLSLNMEYEIFGDRLHVELAGQEFDLIRK